MAADKVGTVTITTDGLTILSLDGATDEAYVAEFDIDGLKRIEEAVATKGGLFYVNQKIEAHFSKSSTSLQQFITSLAEQSACGIVAVIVDNNDMMWVMGVYPDAAGTSGVVKGLYMESGNFDSGFAPDEEDGDKFVVTLTGQIPSAAIPVKSGQVLGTITSGVITQYIIKNPI
ncbi:MAG: hypothetical protein EOL98_12070 [Negativicutes bacterium]|nr:hypothetical protein [Negativicutes bacterium]